MTDIDPDTGLTPAGRRRIEKVVLTPALLGAACLIAGAYGALHNQVSYTVSPDYFHAFKFRQFAVPAAHHDRWGAALVGWAASWWMGVLIGVPIVAPGLRLPGGRAFATRCLTGFALAAATAMVVGLGALAWAAATITDPSQAGFRIPDDAADPIAFCRAGTMHNFSYLGGFLGIFAGAGYVISGIRGRRPQ